VDKTSLVASDPEIEGQVVEALSRAQIPVTAVDWTSLPQFEASKLVVVSSLVDSKGPRESYARILEALSVAGIYQAMPITDIVVLSPEDSSAQDLVRQLKLSAEGSIHLSKRNGPDMPRYSAVFTPYLGSGGAIPSVTLGSDKDLREFLQKRLGVLPEIVNETLGELRQRSSATIPRVRLTFRRAKKLNLAA
jgi:hypothetical protein